LSYCSTTNLSCGTAGLQNDIAVILTFEEEDLQLFRKKLIMTEVTCYHQFEPSICYESINDQ